MRHFRDQMMPTFVTPATSKQRRTSIDCCELSRNPKFVVRHQRSGQRNVHVTLRWPGNATTSPDTLSAVWGTRDMWPLSGTCCLWVQQHRRHLMPSWVREWDSRWRRSFVTTTTTLTGRSRWKTSHGRLNWAQPTSHCRLCTRHCQHRCPGNYSMEKNSSKF